MKKLLHCISDCDMIDPSGNYMGKQYIDQPSWTFFFLLQPLFITTFAPCYPSCSSRFSFGADGSYVLLQPNESFARHDIPSDTPHTNWLNPVTVRDKIRVRFRDAGRPYTITHRRPLVYDIVKPVDGSDFLAWWKNTDSDAE